MHSVAHITPSSSTSPLIFRGCAFSDLVSLTIRIYSSMARYSDALHPLLWLQPQTASTTKYQTLGSRYRYLGPSGTLGERDSALPHLSEKNQPWSQKHMVWPTHCESISGQTWSGPRHGATPSLNPISATAGRVASSLALASFMNCVIPRLSHLRTRLQCQLKFYISNLWSANNIINQRPVSDSKSLRTTDLHNTCSYSCLYVMFDDGDGVGYEW